MVRALDLKKPPSIAESIDWARTLLLMGADDIDRETFSQSMSIIVKHRTDIDLVAERVGMKLPERSPAAGLSRRSGPSKNSWRAASSGVGRRRRRRGGRRGSPTQRPAAAITSGRWVETTIAAPVGAGLGEQLEEDLAARRVEAVEGLVGEQDREGRTRASAIEAFWRMPLAEFGGRASSHPSRPRRSISSLDPRAPASSTPCRAAT